MFTALILICAGGDINSEVCYYSAASVLYSTELECQNAIAEVSPTVGWWDDSLQVRWEPVASRCVNWKAISI